MTKEPELETPRLDAQPALYRFSEESRPTSEYSELREILTQKGLLVKEPTRYIYGILLTISLFALALCVPMISRNLWSQLSSAFLLAFISTRLAFFFHDAGHRQIFSTRWINDVLGLILANLMLGWSYGRWVRSHNLHHANPNEPDRDPDIADVPILAFTPEQALTKRGTTRFLTNHQAYLFLILSLLGSFSWRFRSIEFLLRNKMVRYRQVEILLIVVHSALYFGLLFSLMGFTHALFFILIHQMVFGFYIGSVFAASHKGMKYGCKDTQCGFLRQQVLSTRNIKSNLLSDLWYGPMACHIEHHLFPGMSRDKLKEARIIVKAFCCEHAIPYAETGGLRSYEDALKHLHVIGARVRKE